MFGKLREVRLILKELELMLETYLKINIDNFPKR